MGILDSVLGVFTSVGEWFSSAFTQLIPIFYAENSLTFLGVLAICGLAVGVTLMLIRIIINFLQFRG